jgi:hypothetical protein
MEQDIMGTYGYSEKYFVTENQPELKKVGSRVQWTFDENGNDIYYYEGVRYTPEELEIKLNSYKLKI